jgi:hypothetical protein
LLESQVAQLEAIVTGSFSQLGSLIAQQDQAILSFHEAVTEQQQPYITEMKQHSEELVARNKNHVGVLDSHISSISERLNGWNEETQKQDVDECIRISSEYSASQQSLISQLQKDVESNVDLGVRGRSFRFPPVSFT